MEGVQVDEAFLNAPAGSGVRSTYAADAGLDVSRKEKSRQGTAFREHRQPEDLPKRQCLGGPCANRVSGIQTADKNPALRPGARRITQLFIFWSDSGFCSKRRFGGAYA